MKKIFFFIGLLVVGIALTSCQNKYITKEDGVVITIPAELKEHFVYPDLLPSLTFPLSPVNISNLSNDSSVVFVQNDPYILSDAWASHLANFGNNIIVTNEAYQKNDSKKARFGSDKLPMDNIDEDGNAQKYSVERIIMAWDQSGTRYSYQYRTFISGGKRYYCYCYSTNLTIVMELPVQVITASDQTNKLILLPLPFDTKYEVNINTSTKEALINKDTYKKEEYTKFAYPDGLSQYSQAEQRSLVQEWYTTYCNGRLIDDEFYIDYCGATFLVKFDISKYINSTNSYGPGFQLIYQG